MQWLRFLKRKCPLFNIFMFRICFDLFVLNPQFLVNCVIFYIFVSVLSPRNINYGTRKKKTFKTKLSIMHLKHALLKACQKC